MQCLRLLLTLPMLAAAGCQIGFQTMPTPRSLESVPPLQVERAGPLWLNGLMKAGPWQIRDISRSWSEHRCSQHWASIDSIDSQSYRFTVSLQNNDALHAACEMKRSARFYRLSNLPDEMRHYSKLTCNFSGSSEGKLLLDTQDSGIKDGSVGFGSPGWGIRSVNEDDGALASSIPLGYEISSGYVVVAAVETASGGRIWIDPSLSNEDQHRIMGIASALLLYEPPESQDPDDCQ